MVSDLSADDVVISVFLNERTKPGDFAPKKSPLSRSHGTANRTTVQY